MFEDQKKEAVASDRADNVDVSMMSADKVAEEYQRITNRLNVLKDLVGKPGMDAPTLLEEQRKLDARKAALDERVRVLETGGQEAPIGSEVPAVNDEEDLFSNAVSRSPDGRVAKRVENWRDGQKQ